jgi:Asp-tRNA(Asn)/Glu-tRNA(Gln) amidotransferase A subunit family amidase
MPTDPAPDRRELFAAVAALGVGTAAAAQEPKASAAVTAEMVKNAEWVAGVTLTADERTQVAAQLAGRASGLAAARAVPLPNAVAPAVQFDPAPGLPPYTGPRGTVAPTTDAAPKRPDGEEELAFLPLTSLAALVRTRQVSAVELAKLYLARLRRYDPKLQFVVSFTEELALRQAERADREIAAGRYRGPLHGIPWGAKDLIAVPGYRTTWGAGHYQDQAFPEAATVARRLEAAGAVLAAKTTLGTLALGDVWYGGVTKNPWNPAQGSSGSSAGSASTVAAGCVGFAIGSETLGSIVSPSTRCGVTGLRPTFGRVSRHGCMTLSWSMDKLGPMARSVEDCALVFGAIHGSDGKDPTAVDRPFTWPLKRDLADLTVGVFDGPGGTPEEVRRVLKDVGVKLRTVKLPDGLPVRALQAILTAESAAAFDDITRDGVREGIGFWAVPFRVGRFISAVDYLRANRLRTLLMGQMAELMATVDLYVGGNDLLVTNLTGHPTVCLPGGFVTQRGAEVPTAVTFTGRLYGEAELLAVAKAYQDATGYHLRRPKLDIG